MRIGGIYILHLNITLPKFIHVEACEYWVLPNDKTIKNFDNLTYQVRNQEPIDTGEANFLLFTHTFVWIISFLPIRVWP